MILTDNSDDSIKQLETDNIKDFSEIINPIDNIPIFSIH